MESSFSFTYKGRKTAWYVFKCMCVLLWKGEAWFKVNFSDPKSKAMMDAAEQAALDWDVLQLTLNNIAGAQSQASQVN